MTKGVLLFANNNGTIDYVKQAHYLAQRISKYMGLPTSIVTNVDVKTKNPEYVDAFDKILFDKRLEHASTNKRYHDGDMYDKTTAFHNKNRIHSFELSPYDETLVMDTDYIISNDILNNCFVQQKDLLLYKNAVHIGI